MCKVVLDRCVPLAMYISGYKINSDSQASDMYLDLELFFWGQFTFFRFFLKANWICLMLSLIRMNSIRIYFQITNHDLYVENIKKALSATLFSSFFLHIIQCFVMQGYSYITHLRFQKPYFPRVKSIWVIMFLVLNSH